MNELILRMFAAVQNFRVTTDDERGQTLAEYGLIISVIGVAVVVVGIYTFRASIVSAFGSASSCLNAGTSGASTC
jgi:Flp pilus assembly pilin Flp